LKRKRGAVERGIVITCTHFPLVDKPSLNCLVGAIKAIKPDFFIHLGDIGENEHSGAWQWKKKKRPPLEYQTPLIDQDIRDSNAGMDIIDEALDKAKVSDKTVCLGNHCDWLDRFVHENPYLPQYGSKRAYKLKERGYQVYDCGVLYKRGHLHFYHGHFYGGECHSKNHLTKLSANVMYGHWHDIQCWEITHVDGAKGAYSIGCMKDLSPEANKFLLNRKHKWRNCFAVVDFWDSGYFNVNLCRIFNGKTSLDGKIIDGKKIP